MNTKQEIAVALIKTIKNFNFLGVTFLAGKSTSEYFYLVPDKLAAQAGTSKSHFQNPICFWICLDSGSHRIRLVAGENPRMHPAFHLVYEPSVWDTTNLDTGVGDAWKHNIRVKKEVRWSNVPLEQDPIKRQALIDDLMKEVERDLLHSLKYVSLN